LRVPSCVSGGGVYNAPLTPQRSSCVRVPRGIAARRKEEKRMTDNAALKEIAPPPKGRVVAWGIKRILDDARHAPETYLRHFRAGRGGE